MGLSERKSRFLGKGEGRNGMETNGFWKPWTNEWKADTELERRDKACACKLVRLGGNTLLLNSVSSMYTYVWQGIFGALLAGEDNGSSRRYPFQSLSFIDGKSQLRVMEDHRTFCNP